VVYAFSVSIAVYVGNHIQIRYLIIHAKSVLFLIYLMKKTVGALVEIMHDFKF